VLIIRPVHGFLFLRILLIEDEPLARLELRNLVVAAGHDVVGEASTGSEALRLAGEHRPDVILMDISLLGDLDGIEAARMINDQLAIRSLFVSALVDECRDKVDAARPFGFLLKPVSGRQLMRALDEIARQLGKST
jgi:DNA-binding NarL/FixJ family response regulator